jgi:hypothetical protein
MMRGCEAHVAYLASLELWSFRKLDDRQITSPYDASIPSPYFSLSDSRTSSAFLATHGKLGFQSWAGH